MSIQSEINRIESAKESIVSALQSKGVDVPSTTKLDDMPQLINEELTNKSDISDFVINAVFDADRNGTVDKTATEILTALVAGKTIVCSTLFDGQEAPFRLQLIQYMSNSDMVYMIFAISITTTGYIVGLLISSNDVQVVSEIYDARISIDGTTWSGDESVDFTNVINNMIDAKIPSALKNPKALTFTGAATGSYDGSSAKTVNIPDKTSQLTNDSGYITGYTETDPTVPAWAKASTKPTYTASEVGAAPSSHTHPYLPLSGGTMNDGSTIKLSSYGNRFLTISGNAINADMSNTTGGWAGTFAGVKDPAGDTTTMLGWYGGTGGLTHIFMGGTYSDPYMKMTKAGEFGFKNVPKVGTTNVALTTDIPTSLKNPNAITFTGAVTGTYDGSSAKTVNIPTQPTKTSQLTNDSGYAVVAEVEAVNSKVKQKGVHYIVGNSTTAGVWTGTCNDITEYFDGLTIAYRTNIAGVSDGTTLNINGLGAAAVRRNVSAVTTHYGVDSLLHLTYTTIDGVGYWQMADYDSNTKTSAGTSNKVGSKMYIVGGTSQSSSGVTTYTNKNVYIGTDNCLYSNGKKVTTADDIVATATPQQYGAMGDGSDDTLAFIDALANNRKVYVPSGTYGLSEGIVIRDNCELELAQDAVLNFTNTSGNCITLNMSSSLKGNHATINVPYAFSGNVIYADTATTTNTSAVPPFSKWSPQWKSGRYVTDINICKADSRGFHYSVNGDTNGTAVYISADGSKSLTYMWGVDYSGLRIAGGFKYGIRAVNFNEGWLHEMRIDAFIDACEIGVSLENCNDTYISATIQPRRAFTAADVYLPYAKHGIELINSRNTDLSGSRVWDWHNQDDPKTTENEKTTLWEIDNEYQHIAMKGNCSGTILNDFLYYEQTTMDIRDLIYTDTASNLEKITILQEPFTRWFKPVSGEPYFYNGLDNKKILIEGDLDPYFQTDTIKDYTDVLATATDANGAIFNGIGYQRGVRFTSLATGTDVTASTYYMVTGYMAVTPGTTIYAKDLRFSDTTQSYAGIVYYDSGKARFNNMTIAHVVNGNADFVTNYTETADGCSFVIPNSATLNNKGLAYIRLSFPTSGVGANPAISINKPISETEAGFLADSIKVKDENVIGLSDLYQQSANKVTSISASSTDAQYPSAKAVYTALQSALGEYVTDIASLVGGNA